MSDKIRNRNESKAKPFAFRVKKPALLPLKWCQCTFFYSICKCYAARYNSYGFVVMEEHKRKHNTAHTFEMNLLLKMVVPDTDSNE